MARIFPRILRYLTAALVLAAVGIPAAAQSNSIVTGAKTGTYFEIGSNLRSLVAPTLEVKDSAGSWSNVKALSHAPGVSLAIVQSDVYAAYVRLRDDSDVPAATRAEYRQLLSPLRVFMPLYPEEIHFLVRKEDSIEYIHQIQGKSIWMDRDDSGTSLTVKNVYSKMFNSAAQAVTPFIHPAAPGNDDSTKERNSALLVLSEPKHYTPTYPRIDVMVLVGGQPLKLLAGKIPNNLKLLKFDPGHPSAQRLLREYRRADIRKDSYPLLNIQDNALPSLAVDAYLITANFTDPSRNQFIKQFAQQFCTAFPKLQSEGHLKWRNMLWQPGTPLPVLSSGWLYSDHTKDILKNCGKCPDQDLALNLCK